MSRKTDDERFRDGVRFAITWLQHRALEMNDPKATVVLNSASFQLGVCLASSNFALPKRMERAS